jgi:hypothetical protein
LTVYRGIRAEDSRADRAEKRQVYANCQVAFDRMSAVVAKPGSQAELDSATAAVSTALSVLILIAPDDIGRQAELIRRQLGTYVAGTAGGADSEAQLPGMRKQLLAAMRADLGVPTGTSSEAVTQGTSPGQSDDPSPGGS